MKIESSKLITPSSYARKKGIKPSSVSVQMDLKKVNVIQIIGGRLILLEDE